MASTFSLIPNTQMQATPQKYALKKRHRCPCTKIIWRNRAAPEVTISVMTKMVKNIQANGYFFRDPVHTWIRLHSEYLCAISHAIHTAITAWAVRLDKKLHALLVAHIPGLYSQLKRSNRTPSSVLRAAEAQMLPAPKSLRKGSRWTLLTMPCSSTYKYLVVAI